MAASDSGTLEARRRDWARAQDGAWSGRTNQAAPSQTNSYAQAVAASDANLVAEVNRFLLQGTAVGGQVASEWDPAATRAAERQREATARFLGNWGDGRGGFGSPMGALGATIGMLSSGNVAYAAAAGETTASLDAFAPTGGARVAGNLSSVRRGGALLLEANSGTAGWTSLSRDARTYLRDVEVQSGVRISQEQRTLLAEDLRGNPYSRLGSDDAAFHRAEFSSMRPELVRQWEKNTGQDWPTYTKDIANLDGVVLRRAGQPFDAHHLIASSYGGPNEWWNIHPARFPDQHQGGIHRAGSPARKIFGN